MYILNNLMILYLLQNLLNLFMIFDLEKIQNLIYYILVIFVLMLFHFLNLFTMVTPLGLNKNHYLQLKILELKKLS